MSRNETHELGGWKSIWAMERVDSEARPEEMAPGVRAAMSRASARLDAEVYLTSMEVDLGLVGEAEFGVALSAIS